MFESLLATKHKAGHTHKNHFKAKRRNREDTTVKILVTGAGGFIGSHLCERLLAENHEVRAFIHYNADKIAHLDVEVIRGDVRFPDECMEVTENLDAVVHLAALIHVDRSSRYPRLFWETNVGGTMNMLEAARKHDLRFLQMSTCEVIGDVPKGKADEQYPASAPQSPYAASKLAAETYCKSYFDTYGIDIRIARCFNIAGPRQKVGSKGAVIPIFVDKILRGKTPLIFGSGNQTRDYTDVRDIVDGLARMLLRRGLRGELIHLCSGIEVSVNQLAHIVLDVCQSDMEPVHVHARPGELMRSVGDNSKALRFLRWKPQTGLDATIADIMEYMRERM